MNRLVISGKPVRSGSGTTVSASLRQGVDSQPQEVSLIVSLDSRNELCGTHAHGKFRISLSEVAGIEYVFGGVKFVQKADIKSLEITDLKGGKQSKEKLFFDYTDYSGVLRMGSGSYIPDGTTNGVMVKTGNARIIIDLSSVMSVEFKQVVSKKFANAKGEPILEAVFGRFTFLEGEAASYRIHPESAHPKKPSVSILNHISRLDVIRP